MSIRKRLIISNAAMVLMPVIIIILIILLLNIVLGGSHPFNGFKQGWESPQGENTELFNNLKKVASLEQERLHDEQYIDSLSKQLNDEEAKIIIRKDDNILHATNHTQNVPVKDLPSFGNEGYDPVAWFGNKQYSVKQHDFYFKDGTKGSIFLIDGSESFAQFARTFFPIIFICLLLMLVLTNILLSYFVSRSILRPVKTLSDASSKIRKGDFNFSIRPTRKDELGKLVSSFDDMRAQLKESLELRDKYENNRKELVANISHDLKTPITTILGYVEGLQVGVANTAAKQEHYLDTIHMKAAYMNRLIEELSLYSKLDVKKLPFTFEEVNIKDFIKDYIDEVKDDFNEKDAQLSFVAEDIHAIVLVDRDKLIRVMENLLYNSVKYRSTKQSHIVVSMKDRGQNIEVTITDNGPGVLEAELSNIFKRFYQSEHARQTDGSGLGLAIAKQIIEAHEGTIWAESVSDTGLSVHFTLKKAEDKGDKHE